MKRQCIVLGMIALLALSACGSTALMIVTLNGTVVNPGGSPIAGAMVYFGDGSSLATSGSGTFQKTWPAAIQVPVTITAQGYNTYSETMMLELGTHTKQFQLTAWTADAGLTGTLRGRVQCGETGGGIPGAVVSIEGTSLQTTTDADGYYELDNVPSGDQQINVDKDGYIPYGETEWIFDNFDNVHNPILTPDG